MPLVRNTKAPASDSPAPTLDAASADARFSAARELAGRPEAVGLLSAALSAEGDPRVREAILTSLAQIGDAPSARAIIPLMASDDAGVRAAALDALRVMPEAMSTELVGLLANPDADVRLLACELARSLPAPLASRLLSDLLADEGQANVCAAALDVLAEVGDEAALPVLDQCRARFADVPFLNFAIRIASDRIGAKSAPPGG